MQCICRLQKRQTELGLALHSKCVVLMDCWSVHKSRAFTNWLKKNYPWLLILYIPAGMLAVGICCSCIGEADEILIIKMFNVKSCCLIAASFMISFPSEVLPAVACMVCHVRHQAIQAASMFEAAWIACLSAVSLGMVFAGQELCSLSVMACRLYRQGAAM